MKDNMVEIILFRWLKLDRFKPNQITFLRGFIILFGVFPLLLYNQFRLVIVLLIIAWFTDVVDGLVARSTNTASALGALLDFSFDLILTSLLSFFTFYFALYPHPILPLFMFLLEGLTALGFTILFLPHPNIWQGNLAGKLRGILQSISFVLILSRISHPLVFNLAEATLVLAIISKILSLFFSLRMYFSKVKYK